MTCQLQPTPLAAVELTGRVGATIGGVLAARVTGPHADTVLDEAVAAFRHRVDDRIRPGQGQWQGEFWGKWMLSAVEAYRYTGDTVLLARIARGVHDLLATQREDGYIGTYHDSDFVAGNCWNVWCRKYTLWGLVEAYELLGEPEILAAAQRMMDHLMTEVGPDAVDIIDTGNFVGLPSCSILTPLLRLFHLTEESRYLDYARYIVDQWSSRPGQPPDIVNQGLTGKPVHTWFPDAGRWTKAYEFISCVEGLLDLYLIEGDEDYLRAVRNIYEAIRQHERVITGGIGYHDKLAAAAHRTEGLNEPCDIIYWQRLSSKLLMLNGEPQYADEIERLTYNALLTTPTRNGGWGLRRLGLSEPHLIAPLHCMLHHHQCCIANLPRGLLQLAEVAVMSATGEDAVFINLYIPGQTTVALASGAEVNLDIATDYPETGDIELCLRTHQPTQFALKLRIPSWSGTSELRVNGGAVDSGPPRGYAVVERRWQTGDNIRLRLDVRPRLAPFGDSQECCAVMHGPVVLARCDALGQEAIHQPVRLRTGDENAADVYRVESSPDIWMMFVATTADDKTVHLCDYSSTPGDYPKPDDPADWRSMIDNRTPHELRVWLPQG